jgi:hypothetical protein
MRVVFQLARGIRPQRPPVPWLTDSYWEFIQHCWDLTPTARPSIQEVNDRLSVFHHACVVRVPICSSAVALDPRLTMPAWDWYTPPMSLSISPMDRYDANSRLRLHSVQRRHHHHRPRRGFSMSSVSMQRNSFTYFNTFSIHTTVLPMLNLTLYQALAVDLPPCDSPLDYMHADATHINTIVQDLSTFTRNNDICLTKFTGNDLIYRVRCIHILSS